MTIWTMPKILVEGFASNEYVAACAQMAGVSLSSEAKYIDLDGNGLRTILSSNEDIDDKTSTSIVLEGSTSANRWLNNINFYSNYTYLLLTESYTFPTNYFVDQYDVYFLGDGKTGLLYPTGTYDSSTPPPFTPTSTQNFS